jgi:hypothetical protein
MGATQRRTPDEDVPVLPRDDLAPPDTFDPVIEAYKKDVD